MLYLLTVLAMSAIVTQEKDAILANYKKHIEAIVDAYTNNIYLKEIETQYQRPNMDLPPRQSIVSMHTTRQGGIRTSEGGAKFIVNRDCHMRLGFNKANGYSLIAYKSPLDEDSYETFRGLARGAGPLILRMPYVVGGQFDVRDLLQVKKSDAIRRHSNAFNPKVTIITIKKLLKGTLPVIRFYFRDQRDMMPEHDRHDDVLCHGCFDVAPDLEWVIVGSIYLGYSWDITYEGKIEGIPAIKRATSINKHHTPPIDPYITLEVLEIEKREMNPAEYTLEHYGITLPDTKYAPPAPYWLFACLAALVLMVLGGTLIFLSNQRRKRRSALSTPA